MAGSSGNVPSPLNVSVSVPTRSTGKAAPRPSVTVSSLLGVVAGGTVNCKLTGGNEIVNGTPFDVEPLGPTTVIVTLPGVANKVTGTIACKPPVAGVVARGAPFHRTTEPGSKPVPLTNNVSGAVPPAGELFWLSVEICGRGFTGTSTIIGPFDPITIIWQVPACNNRFAGITAVTKVLEPLVVTSVASAAGGQENCTPGLGPNPVPVITMVTGPSPTVSTGTFVVTEPIG